MYKYVNRGCFFCEINKNSYTQKEIQATHWKMQLKYIWKEKNYQGDQMPMRQKRDTEGTLLLVVVYNIQLRRTLVNKLWGCFRLHYVDKSCNNVTKCIGSHSRLLEKMSFWLEHKYIQYLHWAQ